MKTTSYDEDYTTRIVEKFVSCPVATDSSREKMEGTSRCNKGYVTSTECPADYKNWGRSIDKTDKDRGVGYCFGDTIWGNTWRYYPVGCYKSNYPTIDAAKLSCCNGSTTSNNCDPQYCKNSETCDSFLTTYCQNTLNINKETCSGLWRDSGHGLDYKRIMKQYCKGGNLHHPNCKTFCAEEPESCNDALTTYCKGKHGTSKGDDVCECHYDASIYLDMTKLIAGSYSIDQSALDPRPVCIYNKCKVTGWGAKTAEKANCPDPTITQCFQNINLDATGATINGDINVSQKAECSGYEKKDPTAPLPELPPSVERPKYEHPPDPNDIEPTFENNFGIQDREIFGETLSGKTILIIILISLLVLLFIALLLF